MTRHVFGEAPDTAFLKSSQGTQMVLIRLSTPRRPASDFTDLG